MTRCHKRKGRHFFIQVGWTGPLNQCSLLLSPAAGSTGGLIVLKWSGIILRFPQKVRFCRWCHRRYNRSFAVCKFTCLIVWSAALYIVTQLEEFGYSGSASMFLWQRSSTQGQVLEACTYRNCMKNSWKTVTPQMAFMQQINNTHTHIKSFVSEEEKHWIDLRVSLFSAWWLLFSTLSAQHWAVTSLTSLLCRK